MLFRSVTGVNVFSAGDFAAGDDREEIVFRDAARGVYKRLIVADDRLIGADRAIAQYRRFLRQRLGG